MGRRRWRTVVPVAHGPANRTGSGKPVGSSGTDATWPAMRRGMPVSLTTYVPCCVIQARVGIASSTTACTRPGQLKAHFRPGPRRDCRVRPGAARRGRSVKMLCPTTWSKLPRVGGGSGAHPGWRMHRDCARPPPGTPADTSKRLSIANQASRTAAAAASRVLPHLLAYQPVPSRKRHDQMSNRPSRYSLIWVATGAAVRRQKVLTECCQVPSTGRRRRVDGGERRGSMTESVGAASPTVWFSAAAYADAWPRRCPATDSEDPDRDSPEASHILGYMLMEVKPGIVFTSFR